MSYLYLYLILKLDTVILASIIFMIMFGIAYLLLAWVNEKEKAKNPKKEPDEEYEKHSKIALNICVISMCIAILCPTTKQAAVLLSKKDTNTKIEQLINEDNDGKIPVEHTAKDNND